jgi:serine/threonine-protein kinase HipA
MRTLDVYLERHQVGQLIEGSGIWGFQYQADWLAHCGDFTLIPGLALTDTVQWDQSTTRPVQWFFDNLLPEEAARALLAKSENVPTGDAFALLMAIGHESAGAITLLEPGAELSVGTVVALSQSELAARISKLPKSPMNDTRRKKMSLAGAQHKMLVIYTEDGRVLEPSGQMPSTHILKPEHTDPERYYFTCRNEWFVMSLARACGLPVPEVNIMYVPQAAYIVKRFDRVGAYPDQSRLHMLDGCQLLGIPFGDKYKASTAANLLRLVESCRVVAITKITILRWAIFNAIVGNGDAHLKNLSFRVDADGIQLMPHYDLLSTIIYTSPGQHGGEELSQPMGNAKSFGELTRADIFAFGEELAIPLFLVEKELSRLLLQVQRNAQVVFDSVISQHETTPVAGEVRMLRQVRSLCIDEMVNRLLNSVNIRA